MQSVGEGSGSEHLVISIILFQYILQQTPRDPCLWKGCNEWRRKAHFALRWAQSFRVCSQLVSTAEGRSTDRPGNQDFSCPVGLPSGIAVQAGTHWSSTAQSIFQSHMTQIPTPIVFGLHRAHPDQTTLICWPVTHQSEKQLAVMGVGRPEGLKGHLSLSVPGQDVICFITAAFFLVIKHSPNLKPSLIFGWWDWVQRNLTFNGGSGASARSWLRVAKTTSLFELDAALFHTSSNFLASSR